MTTRVAWFSQACALLITALVTQQDRGEHGMVLFLMMNAQISKQLINAYSVWEQTELLQLIMKALLLSCRTCCQAVFLCECFWV